MPFSFIVLHRTKGNVSKPWVEKLWNGEPGEWTANWQFLELSVSVHFGFLLFMKPAKKLDWKSLEVILVAFMTNLPNALHRTLYKGRPYVFTPTLAIWAQLIVLEKSCKKIPSNRNKLRFWRHSCRNPRALNQLRYYFHIQAQNAYYCNMMQVHFL